LSKCLVHIFELIKSRPKEGYKTTKRNIPLVLVSTKGGDFGSDYELWDNASNEQFSAKNP